MAFVYYDICSITNFIIHENFSKNIYLNLQFHEIFKSAAKKHYFLPELYRFV